jgi:putative transposase
MVPHQLPNRRSVRLRGWDYTRTGPYFVTVCTNRFVPVLGNIRSGVLLPSPVGEVVARRLNELEGHRSGLVLDEHVVMPNHVHMVLWLPGDGAPIGNRNGGIQAPAGALGNVVGAFKAGVSREVAERNLCEVRPLWQRNYHEHVIRGPRELALIRLYVANNPGCWDADPDNPAADP